MDIFAGIVTVAVFACGLGLGIIVTMLAFDVSVRG